MKAGTTPTEPLCFGVRHLAPAMHTGLPRKGLGLFSKEKRAQESHPDFIRNYRGMHFYKGWSTKACHRYSSTYRDGRKHTGCLWCAAGDAQRGDGLGNTSEQSRAESNETNAPSACSSSPLFSCCCLVAHVGADPFCSATADGVGPPKNPPLGSSPRPLGDPSETAEKT